MKLGSDQIPLDHVLVNGNSEARSGGDCDVPVYKLREPGYQLVPERTPRDWIFVELSGLRARHPVQRSGEADAGAETVRNAPHIGLVREARYFTCDGGSTSASDIRLNHFETSLD